MDAPEQRAASQVAAGIVNPITGRRFVKSWRIEELLPAARALYGDLETVIDQQLWYDLPLVRTLFNRGEQNDWLARSGDPGYADFLDDQPALGRIPAITRPAFAYAGVNHSARVDVATLVRCYRLRLRSRNQIFEKALSYSDLQINSAGVVLNQQDQPHAFDRVVFCEGWRARFNPWFAQLPYGGNKGEVLIIHTEAPPLDRLLKHRIFLVPRSDGTYWVGATSNNQWEDEAPTPGGREYLEGRLQELLTVPFQVLDHQAAVRPTVRDRRPLLGRHPDSDSIWIFNGLGTKGASLAPLSSKWLYEHLEFASPLPEEVDIARFKTFGR